MRKRDEHVLGRLDDSVSTFKCHHSVVEVVIRVVEIDINAPVEALAHGLMSLALSVAGHPDAVIRDIHALGLSNWRLTPLEIEYVVGHVVPGLAKILRVVELLVDAAGLILELSARSPRGCESPVALRRVVKEFKDAFTGVQGLDVSAAVLRNPVDTVGA